MKSLKQYLAKGRTIPELGGKILMKCAVKFFERNPLAQRKANLKLWKKRVLEDTGTPFDLAEMAIVQGSLNGSMIRVEDGGNAVEYVLETYGPEQEVMVLVDPRMLTEKEAANKVFRLNSYIRMAEHKNFELRLQRGDQVAISANKLWRRLGGRKRFVAISTLVRIVQRNRRRAGKAVTAALAIWWNDTQRISGTVLVAVEMYIKEHGFVPVRCDYSLDQIIDVAKQNQRRQGESLATNVMRLLGT